MKKTKVLLLVMAMISSVAPLAVQGQGLDPVLLTKPATDSWPTYSGDYSGRRFSSLTQINQTNVKNLGLAWVSTLTPGVSCPGTVFQTRSREPTDDRGRRN